MDNDLKCNRLNCRKILTDKAVVTTCSHIFCVDCANELFNASRSCPACETALMEPDDVVVCSLNPSNDYKTSVLSGLTPATILEICSRAISFWQYQMHQESSFQAAVVRNVNDKNAQLQKQLENMIREANGEISSLNQKIQDLQFDLDAERRKVRELHDSSKDRDKEYTKLKGLYEKMKRKALLAPGITQGPENGGLIPHKSTSGQVDMVVGVMNATGTQRTPLAVRPGGLTAHSNNTGSWQQHAMATGQAGHRVQMHNRLGPTQRRAFNPLIQQPVDIRSHTSMSQRSESANEMNEVENHLIGHIVPPRRKNMPPPPPAWAHPSPVSMRASQTPQVATLSSSTRRVPGTFRPSVINR